MPSSRCKANGMANSTVKPGSKAWTEDNGLQGAGSSVRETALERQGLVRPQVDVDGAIVEHELGWSAIAPQGNVFLILSFGPLR
jgi:hypothetical protein